MRRVRPWLIDKAEGAFALLIAALVVIAAFAALGGIIELMDWLDAEFITSGTPDSVTEDIERGLERPELAPPGIE